MRWPGKAALGIITAGLAALLVWTGRYFVNPDGISYLDLSDDFASGNWSNAVNGHWSPAYPFLLSLWLRTFGAHSRHEALAVHILNGLIFLAAAATFAWLLRELRRSQLPRHDRVMRPWALDLNAPVGVVCAWSVFLWCTLVLITIKVVTPDMLVAAIVFAVGALVLRIREEEASCRTFAAFGLLLGLSYLTKSFMFWVSLVILGMSFLTTRRIRGYPRMHAISLAIFAAVSLLQMIQLSRQAGGFRVSDSARLVYALKVNDVPKFWIGSPPEQGTPVHPLTIIEQKPLTLAFPTAVGNRTYPLWDDPSFWYEGMTLKLDPGQQLDALRNNLRSDFGIAFKILIPLLFAWLIRDRQFAARYRTLTFVPFVVLAGYAVFSSEARLIGTWLAMGVVSALAGISVAADDQRQQLTRTDIYLITAISIVSFVTYAIDQSWSQKPDRGFGARNLQWNVAEALQSRGVTPGSRVALVGDESDIHWARLARVQVALQIPLASADDYWILSTAARDELDRRIASAGATAMIASWTAPPAALPGWSPVPGTRYLIHMLPK